MILYKYYPPSVLEEEKFQAILDKKFWFSSTEQLNDPFDLFGGQCFEKHIYIIRRLIHIVYAIVSEKEKNHKLVYEKVTIIMLYILSEMRKYASCSFSRVPLERLMWAHYADCHKGICFGFEFPENEEIYKVLYMDKFPIETNSKVKESDLMASLRQWIINIEEKKGLIKNKLGGDFKKDFKEKETYIKTFLSKYKSFLHLVSNKEIDNDGSKVIKNLLFIKSQEWVYEQEERMIKTIPKDKDGELKSWSNNTYLREIILGCRFDENKYGNKIQELIKKYSSKLYQVKIESIEDFNLSLKNI